MNIRRLSILTTLIAGLMILGSVRALDLELQLVSVNPAGTSPANLRSETFSVISANGRYVAFSSYANNLVTGVVAGGQTYVRDLQTQQTFHVSKSTGGVAANDTTAVESISADSRFVVFKSRASNLVANEDLFFEDVFVHDRQTGQTTRVSENSAGEELNAFSFGGSISADGRYIVFVSLADNVVANDTNNTIDVFLRDQQTNQVLLLSKSSASVQGNKGSTTPVISQDGRYVAFASFSTNLVTGDTNGFLDIFVHALQTGQTERVSLTSNGAQADRDVEHPSISADGRFVAFDSFAFNLVPGDSNNRTDVFVRDRLTARTERVSIASGGGQSNNYSNYGTISGDGRYITFNSEASNLVSGDTNTVYDAFVHDRINKQTRRVSVTNSGEQAQGSSVTLSSDGQTIAFASAAPNLSSLLLPTNTNIHIYAGNNVLWQEPPPSINYVNSLPMTLTWSGITWAANYEVRVDYSEAFNSAPLPYSTTTSALQTTVTSLPEGQYYWQVRALQANGTPGAWSETASFTVDLP